MSDTLPNLDKIESKVHIVPASVEEVESAIREATVRISVPGLGNPYRATVRNGKVLMTKREGRNPMRAQLRATLEPVPSGTKIAAEAGLPSYARWVGRGATLIALLIGVVQIAVLAIGGRPDDMSQFLYFALFAGAFWMPFVAWLIPGMLVNRSVAQRAELLEHLDSAIAPLGRLPMEAAVPSTSATREVERQAE